MKFEEKFVFQPDQMSYDVRIKHRSNWWWLLLLLLVPLLLFLLSRCNRVVPVPPLIDEDSLMVDSLVVDSVVFTHPVQVLLSWETSDDLDLHVFEPSGYHIYHRDRCNAETGGCLNIDMNVSRIRLHPKEHVSWSDCSNMEEGVYKVCICNFKNREEIASQPVCIDLIYNQSAYRITFDAIFSDQELLEVASFSWTQSNGVILLESIAPHQEIQL